jgi:hypothetical protein
MEAIYYQLRSGMVIMNSEEGRKESEYILSHLPDIVERD